MRDQSFYQKNLELLLNIVNDRLQRARYDAVPLTTHLVNFSINSKGDVSDSLFEFIFEVTNDKYGSKTRLVEKSNSATPDIITIGINFYDSDDFLKFTMSQWLKTI